MTVYVDIDGTITRNCKYNTDSPNYTNAKPNRRNIKKINKLFSDGHIIVYWTARGTKTGNNWFMVTFNQLNKWGCRFHELRMNKPAFDLLIDDKTKRIEEV